MNREDFQLVLVLSGGNALGAYQAGGYQALAERGIEFDWIVGASIGAVNGAIICGNPPHLRLERLHDFWRPAAVRPDAMAMCGSIVEQARRTASAQVGLALGRPDIFVPRRLFGPWCEPFGNSEPSSLYDTIPLEATLRRIVDFDRLNAGRTRFSVTAVDVELGEDVLFDNRVDAIGPRHLRASTAFLPLFPPTEIGGRWLVDAGASANLPIDIVLGDPPAVPTLCLAIDLLAPQGARPATLGDSTERIQDLIFATQSRRAIEGWKRYYELRARMETKSTEARTPSVTLVHLAYHAQHPEVCGKTFDYSPGSAAYRWDQGYRDVAQAFDELGDLHCLTGRSGLTVHAFRVQEAN